MIPTTLSQSGECQLESHGTFCKVCSIYILFEISCLNFPITDTIYYFFKSVL